MKKTHPYRGTVFFFVIHCFSAKIFSPCKKDLFSGSRLKGEKKERIYDRKNSIDLCCCGGVVFLRRRFLSRKCGNLSFRRAKKRMEHFDGEIKKVAGTIKTQKRGIGARENQRGSSPGKLPETERKRQTQKEGMQMLYGQQRQFYGEIFKKYAPVLLQRLRQSGA
ncbi:MAG: hypothetical protein MJ016_04105 [Victivallaceae bacterium]|nr:hypothetical protein [Victivallaceae bacterium]